MQKSEIELTMITSNAALAERCALLAGKPFLAVDTEFIRTDTFYPLAGLLQFNDGEEIFFVDPLQIDDFSPLKVVFEDESIVKIFHACSEDLQLFKLLIGVMPKPIFDTQIAAALLGYGVSISYLNIVKEMVGVELNKGETRSDWLKRPLSESQLHYAEQDVIYLPEMYQLLSEQLKQKQRYAWLVEDCGVMLSDIDGLDNIDNHYFKLKSLWKLDRQGLAIIKELSVWREQEARQRNRPRNHIMKERLIWEVAETKPTNTEKLSLIKEMPARIVREYGGIIIDSVDDVCGRDKESYPPLHPKPLPSSEMVMLKKLKSVTQGIADQLGISVEILMKKRDYEELVRTGLESNRYQLPKGLSRWRKELLAEPLLQVLQ